MELWTEGHFGSVHSCLAPGSHSINTCQMIYTTHGAQCLAPSKLPGTGPSHCRRLCSLLLNVHSFCGSAASRSGYESASKDFVPDDLEVQVPGRAFMVTGGNSGIGKATAMEIAKRGEQPAKSCVCWAPRAACGQSTLGRGPCVTHGSGRPQPAQAGTLDRDPVLTGTAAGFLLLFSRSVMSDPL